MSAIVTCTCGARIGLPEETENRRFRCPRCKVGIALAADGQVLRAVGLSADAAGRMCAICQTRLAGQEAVVKCPKCDQFYHQECWAEVGGCGTYGCENAPSPDKETAVQQPLAAWGDTKTCPACGETIKAIALRCRYCGTNFDTVDPLTVADLRVKAMKGEEARGLRKTVVTLFVLSVLGCLAPIVAIAGTVILLPKRRLLAKQGPVFVVLAYSAIGLSVVYSILMALFLFFSG
ncbi:MAG TPA: hypothetical protein EYP56_21405 [Planctomycetaceae bacterium]|nr:hypothetical protein [Planctomycetaceae bacterium]